MIVGGSDWDVSSYNPFCAFQTAVTRRGGKGPEQKPGQEQKPLNSDQGILIDAAVDAYTINAAFALKQQAIIGSLEVGKRADLIVVDRDIFSIDSDTIADTKVLMTYLDGRLVYPANGTPSKRPPSCECGEDVAQQSFALKPMRIRLLHDRSCSPTLSTASVISRRTDKPAPCPLYPQ